MAVAKYLSRWAGMPQGLQEARGDKNGDIVDGTTDEPCGLRSAEACGWIRQDRNSLRSGFMFVLLATALDRIVVADITTDPGDSCVGGTQSIHGWHTRSGKVNLGHR